MKRWMRAAIPFAVLTTLVSGTLIVHAIEQPDPDDPEYLAPDQVREISGGTLAERLRARGVTVERATSTEAAVQAATAADAAVTLFVTTPDLADLTAVRRLPAGSTIVAVDPSPSALRRSGWPAEVSRTHWTTAVTAPFCGEKLANEAGPAAVRKTEYRTPAAGTTCYQGALVTFPVNRHSVTLVGSPDPFRDDRITEHGNATLAVGLLAQHERLVWLDVHTPDRPPRTTPPTTPPTWTPPPGYDETPQPWQTGGIPGDGDGRGEPGDGDPGAPATPATPPPGDGEDEGLGSGPMDPPLLQSLPPALWATLLLIVLVMLALAAAAARRLGAPVAEPLPSRVPANETMLGHARLYQRARARAASHDILRTAARRRLAAHLGLPADADSEAIAAQAGLPVRYVRDILDRHPPESNSDLVEAATLLHRLVRDVTEPHRHEGEQS
ncbi:hypothetical protein QLQ12_41605 [Actinoplanes sp. NEAU-A12]|uniref:DUF4350 domain-containing protein n=1 Tax=Actinoplanes sandaracinus TaxID=3045177 RepID=A0ABT6WZC5_9ACTN|nr:DUF4350 domain-containing protein [Actinoplanes sandaracinus]MDI6105101.1 hypothetical protein [Actinoplanes sandaracinus]